MDYIGENMKTRREFLLSLPLFILACTGKKKMSDEEVKKLQEQAAQYHKNIDKKLISEGHPLAITFKYIQDGTTASANLNKSARSGVPPQDQLCKTCQFYTAIGDDYGSCQILPPGNVTANGYCFSWAKKPTAMPTENS